MKKLPLMAVMAVVLAAALWHAPGARAESPGTKKVLWAFLGGVQVIDGRATTWANYRCDEGYRYARWEAWLQLANSSFRFRPACDGYTHVFSAQAPAPDDSSVHAELYVHIFDDIDNPGDDLVAQDKATYFSDGSGAIADADIGYARVDDQGRLEVSLKYQCAAGLAVPKESASDRDYVEAYQVRGDLRMRTVWSARESVDEQIVCDGTRHLIVLHMQGYRSDGAPAHPRMRPIQVNAFLVVTDPADPTVGGEAIRRITVLP
jgi:hypothetical protein